MGEDYLFTRIKKKAGVHASAENVIDLGIGDVTLPLSSRIADAICEAAREQESASGFRGYPPTEGYDFLRRAIAARYLSIGATVSEDEIYISDGAKTDLSLMPLLFERCTAYLPDPAYPVYRDSNLVVGNKVRYIRGTRENGFLPLPPRTCGGGIYYICSPGNPTGAAYDYSELECWVDHVKRNGSVLIFDAAYSDYIPPTDTSHPRSIFCIPGARECAVEICSFSKSAGFTGLRCGYTVIPSALTIGGTKLAATWRRYRAMSFNGVSYPIQRAAAAALTPEGSADCRADIAQYRESAEILRNAWSERGEQGFTRGFGPYAWLQCPRGMSSWEFFELFLDRAGIICTPGAGFGRSGEGYFRLSGFCGKTIAALAAERIREFKF